MSHVTCHAAHARCKSLGLTLCGGGGALCLVVFCPLWGAQIHVLSSRHLPGLVHRMQASTCITCSSGPGRAWSLCRDKRYETDPFLYLTLRGQNRGFAYFKAKMGKVGGYSMFAFSCSCSFWSCRSSGRLAIICCNRYFPNGRAAGFETQRPSNRRGQTPIVDVCCAMRPDMRLPSCFVQQVKRQSFRVCGICK